MSDAEKSDKNDAKGKKKSPLMLVLLLLLGAGAGVGAMKFLGGSAASGEAAAEVEPPPEAGEVAAIEATNINLADGHFLRIAVGAQLTKEVTVKPDVWAEGEGTKVRDAIIEVFSGRTMAELQTTEGRHGAVEQLTHMAVERTEKQVMAIYLSEFVMQ